jgi:thiol-disulfide isomerase/thioredoxin
VLFRFLLKILFILYYKIHDMRTVYIVFIMLLLVSASCKTTAPAAGTATETVRNPEPAIPPVNYSDATTWVLGYFKISRLTHAPHSAWFIKGMDDYTFNSEAVSLLKAMNMEGLSIKVVIGTWCPDSRREVPRFMRILKEINFPEENVRWIGVDNMKISPIDKYDALNIERVPTFIFYKNNIEAGRIIENPSASLEQDMVSILTGNEEQ